MATLSLNSAGVSTQEIDRTGPVTQSPVGIPAGVIGIAAKGPAFVPVTIGNFGDFSAKFGPSDGRSFGPLAVSEWLRTAGSATYLRVLGTGTGEKRTTTGNTAGAVTSAGFVVGQQQPTVDGNLGANPYANTNGVPGRTYFLGCYMSESNGSTVFSSAGIQPSTGSLPIIRGVVLAPSGVVLRLSQSLVASAAPTSTAVAVDGSGQGALTGTVRLLEGGVVKQEFVMLLNGHKGTDANFPNVITASFDMTAQNYFANVLNTDPLKQQQAGHYLYTHYDIHPSMAAVTGSGLLNRDPLGGSSLLDFPTGFSPIAFLTTGTLGRNVGDSTAPNYENFEDRYDAPRSPWLISQKFGGTPSNLFRVEALDDGDYTQRAIKVSIENIAASSDDANQYGTFDLLVRDIDDTDEDFTPLEEFRGLSLDPGSDRYVAKVVGDLKAFYDFDKIAASQKLVIQGSFPNASNWIRVVMDTKVDNAEVDPTALPFGFRGHPHLVTSGSAPLTNAPETLNTGSQVAATDIVKRATQVPVPLRGHLLVGPGSKAQTDPSLFWGVKFQQTIDPLEPNKGKLPDKTIRALAKYFPDFMTAVQNVIAADNSGVSDTAADGILDVDRFNRNMFSLENVRVTTGSDTRADVKTTDDWTYVRAGNIAADDAAKTRGMSADDLKKPSVRTYAKYSLYLQGGFDGVNVFDSDTARLTNQAVQEEMDNANRGTNNGPTVKSYAKAIQIMKETSDVDIKLLAIPGLRHSVITDAAVLAVEDRFDAMFIMDIDSYDSINALVTSSNVQDDHVANTVNAFVNRNLDSNFAAAYYPDVLMTDPTTETILRVPPSVAVLGAFALNDSIGQPWFAPAGFTRGALRDKEAAVKLARENLDDLYAADINPIVAFPNSNGPVVWGQKTLQKAQSALDRVNVRRLLIEIRRQVRDVANTILFEPNRESTLSRFQQAVRPRLEAIQARQGVDRFKVVIDSTSTSVADVEAGVIRGKIIVSPVRSAEFVSISFEVSNQGQNI